MMKPTSAHVLALSLCATLACATGKLSAADLPQFTADVSAGHNTNLNQAERDRDIIDDNFITLNLAATYTKTLPPTQQLTLKGFVETEQWQEVRDISRLTAGGEVGFGWTPAPGPTALSLQATAGIRADDYDHDQRDSTVVTAKLVASKQLTTLARASVGISWRDRDSDGTVWDLQHVRGFLNGAYAFRPGWSAHGTYSYIDGDVWSTAQTTFCNGAVAGDLFGLINAADALEPDGAFNNEFCSAAVWTAYRLPAETNTFEVGINKEFGQSMVLDFSFLHIDVDARGSNEYDTQVYRLSLQKRF